MTELVVAESIVVEEPTSDAEDMRLSLLVAQERGHPSPSVVVGDDGRTVTHRDYVDSMGVAHQGAGVWAFARRPAAEALGGLVGSDWVRIRRPDWLGDHDDPYPLRPLLRRQLYLQRFGTRDPHMMTPVASVASAAFRPDGARVCVVEDCAYGSARNVAVRLWEYELGRGTRRLIAGFPNDEHLASADAQYSGDGAYIHLCSPVSGRNILVRVADGLVIALPFRAAAASWNFRDGPNAMVVMGMSGIDLVVNDFDLASGRMSPRCTIASPNGAPLLVRQLTVSADGRALVTAPVGASGAMQARRGGEHIAAFVDLDEATLDPVLPICFRTRGAYRRHSSPRWCENLASFRPGRTSPAEHLLHAASLTPPEEGRPDPSEVEEWTDLMRSFALRWERGGMPRSRFAQDFAQYALACADIEDDQALEIVDRLRADRHPVARAVVAWIGETSLLWPPLAPDVRDDLVTPSDVELPALDFIERLTVAIDAIIAAGAAAPMREASASLIELYERAGVTTLSLWSRLARLTNDLMAAHEFELVTRIALATFLWNSVQPAVLPIDPDRELGATDAQTATPIVLNGFEACAHLFDGLVIGNDAFNVYDIDLVRRLLGGTLGRLPIANHAAANDRPTRSAWLIDPVPDPARVPFRRKERGTMGRPRVFVSYLHEDLPRVEPIIVRLRAAGIDVDWDKTSLGPGVKWRAEIRRQIRSADNVVVCFSNGYLGRTRTYLSEELRTAIAEQRTMPERHTWLVSILLDQCGVPDFEIDATTQLSDLQYIDFSSDWEDAVERLIRAILPDRQPPGEEQE